MRPLKIDIQAFGAFAGKVHLDFNDLKGRNMFLIQGPTGSGKTTILDAMVYALYGRTSGDRTGNEMRSDYADGTIETIVVFTFAIGEKQYRITRSPEQFLNKRRGEGQKKVTSQVTLEIWNEESNAWEQKSTRAKEINDTVEGILGFKLEQFKQVILLPQGEFRKVLVANSSDRGKILSELFNTTMYEEFQKELNERAKAAKANCEKTVEKESRILEDEKVASFDELMEKEKGLIEEEIQASKALETEQEKNKQYRTWENIVVDRSQKLLSIKEQERIFTALQEQSEEFGDKRERLKKLKDYKEIYQVWLQREKDEASWNEAKSQFVNLQNEEAIIIKKSEDLERRWKEYEEKSSYRETLREEKKELENKIAKWEQWEKLYNDLQTLEKEEKEAGDAAQVEKKELCLWEEELTQYKESYQKNQDILKEMQSVDKAESELSHAIEQKKKFLAQREKLEKQYQNILDKKAALEGIVAEEQQAKRIVLTLEKYLEEQEAYHLSMCLEEDKPCPVCGSIEHPHKAEEPEELVKKSDVDEKKEDYQKLRDRLMGAQKEIETLEESYRDAQTALELEEKEIDKEELPQLEEKWRLLQEKLQGKKEREQQCETLEQSMNTLAAKIEEKKKKYEEAQHMFLQKSGACKNLRAQKEDLEKKEELTIEKGATMRARYSEVEDTLQKEEAYGESLKEEKQSMGTEKIRIQTAVEAATKQIAERQHQWQSQSEVLEGMLQEKQISEDEGKILAEQLDEIDVLQKKCEDYDRQVENVKTLLNREKEEASNLYQKYIENLPLNVENDILSLQNICPETDDEAWIRLVEAVKEYGREIENRMTEQIRTYGALTEKVKITAKHVEDLKKIRDENEKGHALYAMVQNLADIASGRKGKAKQFNFTNYVLRAILQEVLIAANLRLQKMSRRRYTLEAKPLAETSQGHQGLDISVMDAYTGVLRNVATLSGGETFLASLSLALGMADVVQAYSGGTQMEAMFIDEGFGTLDEETLDIAMDALLQLQTGGRLIGIISHVDGLKKRIESQLIVSKDKKGSTAKFSVGA